MEEHLRSHPLDDPYAFAMRMRGNIILGVYADCDGTLLASREGHDGKNLFSPRLARALNKTIEKTGLFTIASACHVKRALVLLTKAGEQVPLDRILFFAENGHAAVIPLKRGRHYDFEVYRAPIPDSRRVLQRTKYVRESLSLHQKLDGRMYTLPGYLAGRNDSKRHGAVPRSWRRV